MTDAHRVELISMAEDPKNQLAAAQSRLATGHSTAPALPRPSPDRRHTSIGEYYVRQLVLAV